MKLYPHQKQVLDQTRDFKNVAYYLDMGLGKTFVGSEKMFQIGNRVNLVICQKSKIEDWAKHFEQYNSPDEYHNFNMIYDLTDKHQYEAFTNVVTDHGYTQTVIGIINYELAWRRPDLKFLRYFTLILDESSMIQNESAKRTKFILNLNPKNVILLSGTPTSGRYEKLWSQLQLLGWSVSKKTYYSQFVIQDFIDVYGCSFKIPVVIGYKNVDRLKAKLAAHGAVFMKTEEVMDLPEQTHINVSVPTTPAYRRFMKKHMVWVDNEQLIGDTTLTQRLYARQLCGQYNEDKLQAFRNILESSGDRVIVFYNFNRELDELMTVCKLTERPVSVINGSVKDLTAYEKERDSVTLVQYQAGSMGLNLQLSNTIIYFTLPERSELFEQSKKRIHRIGQTRPCFYYYLLCKGSVEVSIMQALKMRKDYTDELFIHDFVEEK